jgi:hypothetical protein
MRTAVRDEEELRVFREFLVQADLPVVPESIEKRHPPEPDILCSLSDDSRIAFELVEVCHRENAVFFGSAGVIGDLLEKTYVELPSELRRRFDFRFAGRPLSFSFTPDATRNRIRVALPRIFAELIDQADKDGQFSGFSTGIQKVLRTVRIAGRVYEPGRPAFNVAGSFQPEDVVVETVQSKVSKSYRTPHPIELLAHFGGLAWGKSVRWNNHLSEALLAQGLGPFRRVWVLGWDGIRFVYPTVWDEPSHK